MLEVLRPLNKYKYRWIRGPGTIFFIVGQAPPSLPSPTNPLRLSFPFPPFPFLPFPSLSSPPLSSPIFSSVPSLSLRSRLLKSSYGTGDAVSSPNAIWEGDPAEIEFGAFWLHIMPFWWQAIRCRCEICS